jgi:lipopolysaccharide transport system ATP-binding protein
MPNDIPVIRVDGLGKEYRIGGRQVAYRTLREALTRTVLSPLRRAGAVMHGHAAQGGDESFWALSDVSFEIKRGEIVGVIGRNGAGKSTLLKVLSRITEPTRGEIRLRGRVGALLEVGTGFHPELSGRDNVFLNGAILGMRRQEIHKKFDAIVAFAEVDKFIDTPVKHYSSGMYMRLAFAIAAHLQPEILIVDEVLAVGDAGFQKKCMGKMSEVAHEGRTVLFVSHNASAIRNLCSRAILLRAGQLVADGPANLVLTQYESANRQVQVTADTAIGDERFRRGSGEARFTFIALQDRDGNSRQDFEPGETICFAFAYECRAPISALSICVALRSGATGELATSITARVAATGLPAGAKGTCFVEFPDNLLRPGEYPLYFWLGRSALHPFDVVDGLTAPLTIFSRRSAEALGYDPQNPAGIFSIPFLFRETSPNGTCPADRDVSFDSRN